MSEFFLSEYLVRFAWAGLGNLAIAIPMAALAWGCGRSGRPALTHALWVLVLLKLATPPLGHVPFDFGPTVPPPIHVDAPQLPIDAAPVELPVAQLPAAAEVAAPIDWPALLGTAACTVWLVGTFVVFGWALVQLVRFRRLLRLAAPAPDAIAGEASRLAEALGVSCPRIVLLPGAISPLLWVGWRAYLVVPADLLQRLDGQQRTALLLHELAHWRRGDHWVRRLEAVAVALYWWCPLVWWAKSQAQQAEEECCDAWVVATVPEAVRAYALALVETVDFLSGDKSALPPLASGLGPFPSLRRRLTMIFRNPMPRMLTAPTLCGLGLVAALCLSWSPMPASVLAQDSPRTRKPAPPADDEPEAPRDVRRTKAREPKDLQREVERLEKEIADTLRELQAVKDQERARAREDRQEGGREVRKDERKEEKTNTDPRDTAVDALKSMILKQRQEAERARADAMKADRARLEAAKEKERKKGSDKNFEPRGPIVLEMQTGGGNRGDLEKRMTEVERKLDTILWTLTELRRASAASAGQSRGGTKAQPPTPPMPPGGPAVPPPTRGNGGPDARTFNPDAFDPTPANRPPGFDRSTGRPRPEEPLPAPKRERQEER